MPFGPANEIAVRSRKLMKNISATNGTSRHETFRIADRSTACGSAAFIVPSSGGLNEVFLVQLV